jgi:hypothetical protein
MEFRWVALIALWTSISGPIFVPVAPPTPAKPAHVSHVTPHTAPH